jgi:ankyrin repeat protein
MRTFHRMLMTACALTAVALPTIAQGPPPVEDPLGPDLFIAIRENRTDDVRALLKKGAKTEAKNWLGMTPLMWAAMIGNESACAALIESKANVKADCIYGSALETGILGGNPKVIRLLLDNGATFSKERVDKITALMAAADQGHTEILRMLLAAKADVNAADEAGMTALMHASRRGQAENAKLLLDAGANVNTSDIFGMTALHYAALNGHVDAARLLLAKGAKVDATDKTGSTPLLLNARYSGVPQLATLLIKSGANPSAKDATGRTACDLAMSRGYAACARAIRPDVKMAATEPAGDIPARAHRAVLTSLDLIQRTTKAFSARGGCFSCHHQGLGLVTTGTARALGYRIDSALAAAEQKLVTSEPETKLDQLRGLASHPEAYKFFPAVDMQELVPGVSMTYCGLAAHEAPKSEALGIVATIMARQQTPDGAFHFVFHREPLQSSQFMTTAYAVRTMKAYLPDSMAKERDERVAKALDWLQKTPAVTNEDRAFRLLGLKWAGGSQSDIETATADLLRTQKADGGWAQFSSAFAGGPGFDRADAYATGESLYALYVGGGIKPDAQPYRRGVRYLLRTQDEDGSWFVNKRAVPANNWFDTGFPHGESQYISYSATCWSAMALMFAADKPSVASASR